MTVELLMSRLMRERTHDQKILHGIRLHKKRKGKKREGKGRKEGRKEREGAGREGGRERPKLIRGYFSF